MPRFLELERRIDQIKGDLSDRAASLKATGSVDAIRNIRRGHKPSVDTLVALASTFERPSDFLLATMGGSRSAGEAGANMLAKARREVPVIDKVRAGQWTETAGPYINGYSDTIKPDRAVSSMAFALDVEGDSMEPDFREKDRIVVDPAVEARPGDFVVAKREEDHAATFKCYRLRGEVDGNKLIDLVPLNPMHPTLSIDPEHPGRIIGVVVEYRRYRKSFNDDR